MKIVSWNVNGIRACLSKNFTEVLQKSEADFFCVQESKASEDQVDCTWLGPEWKTTWASAQKKGYSGCTLFSRHPKVELSSRLGIPKYDAEGRANLAFHKDFTLVNLYFPNGAASDERHHFKMGFLKDILVYLKKLEAERGPLVVVGDYNIAHREIDIHDPVRNQDSSGFRPEERDWMTRFLEAGFIDTFRALHPETKDEYSWWSFRQASRARNKGWRIDYICISEALRPALKSAKIRQEISGSDHCPVEVTLSL